MFCSFRIKQKCSRVFVVCVGLEREREKEGVCVCVCERERERVRERAKHTEPHRQSYKI